MHKDRQWLRQLNINIWWAAVSKQLGIMNLKTQALLPDICNDHLPRSDTC